MVMRGTLPGAAPVVAGGPEAVGQPPPAGGLPTSLSGTANIPDYGLEAALEYVLARQEAIRVHEAALLARMLDGLAQIRGIAVPGGPGAAERVAVVSVDFERSDNALAALRLEAEFGILTRCGLHCAPRPTGLGTIPGGLCAFPRLGEHREMWTGR
jgi:selenocysteine lyase/cysteine desulfurase